MIGVSVGVFLLGFFRKQFFPRGFWTIFSFGNLVSVPWSLRARHQAPTKAMGYKGLGSMSPYIMSMRHHRVDFAAHEVDPMGLLLGNES